MGPHNIFIFNALCPTVILTKWAHDIWDQSFHGKTQTIRKRKETLHRFGEPSGVASGLIPGQSASDFVQGVFSSLDGRHDNPP